jgi:putative membrane protein
MKRSPRDYVLLALKGIGMGAADVVPGVSGGTIAFITGIYTELITSLKSVSSAVTRDLLSFNLKEFWISINGKFLLAVLSGVLLSIVALTRTILYLLEYYPIHLWSFFFGLIIASAIIVSQRIINWNVNVTVSALTGAIIAFAITEASPVQTPTAHWFIFLSGFIAICAMILPGISGSFILLLLGKYEYILSAVKELKIVVILIFIAGCISGLLAFSHVLTWLLKRYHDIAVALLAGFMIGSLNKVWPWKKTISSFINEKGIAKPIEQENIMPGNYFAETGNEPFLLAALTLVIVGFFIVILLERIGSIFNIQKV